MSTALDNRAAAIRDYLERSGPPLGPATDPTMARRYSLVAARWEQLRLADHRGLATPGDHARLMELTAVMRALSKRMGLPVCREDTKDPDAIPGVTTWRGFLPLDPSRILSGECWQTAADGW